MPIVCSHQRKKATPFGFPKLAALRLLCEQIQQDQVASLEYFRYDVGFRHVPSRAKISVSSTATCVLSLIATDSWAASKANTKKLLKDLIPMKTSALLKEDNPFTTAWILEAVGALRDRSEPLDESDNEEVARKEEVLRAALSKGGVSIETYPASGYLTQLVVRVLRGAGKMTPELEEKVDKWAWAELAKQLALIQARSRTQDAFAVAYLLMLVASGTPSSRINPEQASIRRSALKALFDCQLEDGSWPLSRPLFHYPGFGNAYCYEYEMLTQLLKEPELREMLLGFLPNLGMAAEAILTSAYRVEGGIPAWTSGHHPNQAEPESWATASVYHFIHELDRLLAEAVRRELFRYLDQPLPRTVRRDKRNKEDFAPAPGFLDSKLDLPGKQGQPLRDFLWEKFVQPLSAEADKIEAGREFKRETPRSAIFFGPPGTSKTELSKKVAEFLGWPLLVIDPSLLLRKGMDGMQGEANTIFRMLEQTERVVVLFDEFDELVRERGSSDSEPFSRLLTTAMLPKLASIHKGGTLVFIIATNYVGEFDLAIRRRGRFDRVVQIMPPTYEAKMAKSDWGPEKNLDLAARVRDLNVELTDEVKGQIGDLTYDECEQFVIELSKAQNVQQATSALAAIWKQCTLQTSVSKGEESTTWADRCRAEATLSH
jgi:ATPase family associated with various cellular activities (AAA)